MYVKDHMTADPITISKNTSLLDALEIMGKNKFHRLPVVEDGKLIGLVTEGLVDESSGRDKTSLSIYELNYLLSRTKASDIMITDVKTIGPDAWIEEASQLMLDSAINVLPVVNDKNEVLGLITKRSLPCLYRSYGIQESRNTLCHQNDGQTRRVCKALLTLCRRGRQHRKHRSLSQRRPRCRSRDTRNR